MVRVVLRGYPNENKPFIGKLKAPNLSPSGIFECFKFGKPYPDLEVGKKTCEHFINASLLRRWKNHVMMRKEYNTIPIFHEYPSEELEGALDGNCGIEIKYDFEDLSILD